MATSPYITDVTDASFDHDVIIRSRQAPVLVDFWAAWCGPCQALMPILAKLAEEYQGRFFLAKVNSDEHQGLAARFGVRGLPTVKLFKNGAEVAEFVGAQPERTIRAFLDQHVPRASDALVDAALAAENAGGSEHALAQLRSIHESDPGNDRAGIHLARLLLEQGEVDESERVLRGISARAGGDPELSALMARLEFLRLASGAPPLPALEETVKTRSGDLQARVWLAARYVLAGRYEAALEQWLAIVKADRGFGDDIGRRGLLSTFALMGGKGELVRKYRGLLALAIT